MNYAKLKEKVLSEYIGVDPEAVCETLNAKTQKVLVSSNWTYKQLLGVLTPDEFREASSLVKQAAALDDYTATAASLLSSDGLDFGNASTQSMLDQLFSSKPELCEKLKSLGYATISILEKEGIAAPGECVAPAQIRRVRS